jgi:ADP-ribose pyrophosphatase YjhB (NUDIX family)
LNFCSNCGAPVETKIPPGDHLPRFVCTSCGMVHYKNPLLVLGCVPEWQNKILLCKRAIEPRLGFWTVPAGFMENGETMQAAAARECYEEALAKVEIGSLLAVVNVTRANQVHVMFRAKLLAPEFAPGPESLEVGLYEESEIPWSDLAFASGEYTLRKYFEDRAAGREDHHFTELIIRRAT